MTTTSTSKPCRWTQNRLQDSCNFASKITSTSPPRCLQHRLNFASKITPRYLQDDSKMVPKGSFFDSIGRLPRPHFRDDFRLPFGPQFGSLLSLPRSPFWLHFHSQIGPLRGGSGAGPKAKSGPPQFGRLLFLQKKLVGPSPDLLFGLRKTIARSLPRASVFDPQNPYFGHEF